MLGRPGAGKTTSLQRISLSLLQKYDRGSPHVPIFLRFRDLRPKESLGDKLCSMLGLRVVKKEVPDTTVVVSEADLRNARRKAVSAYLERARAVLLLDGLDEVSPRKRGAVEDEVKDLLSATKNARIVLTCRTADFVLELPRTTKYTILPLSRQQIERFAAKWLGARKGQLFMGKLDRSPYSGAEALPLTIAHLCAIYERRNDIPDRPRTVYRLIVRLLLTDWDEQHGVQRRSRYAEFDVDRKEEFLRHIAYALTVAGHRGAFTHEALQRAYLDIFEAFSLPKYECAQVAREIESHSGLILRSSEDSFEFAHKSLQEFLAAEWIGGLPSLPGDRLLDVPEEIGIATALSSRPDLYMEQVATTLVAKRDVEAVSRFAAVYLGRLAAERADVRPAAWIGWTCLALLHLSLPSSPGTHVAQKAASAYAAFTKLMDTDENLRWALRLALDEAEMTVVNPSTVMLSPPHDVRVPAALRSTLSGADKHGIAVDRMLIQRLRGVDHNAVHG